MKVAVVSSAALPSPPPLYGGLEMIAFTDALRLSERHDVVLVAAKGSASSADVYCEMFGLKCGFDIVEAFEGGVEGDVSELLKTIGADVLIDHSWTKAPSRALLPSVQVLHGVYKPPHPAPNPAAVSVSHAALEAGILGANVKYVYGHLPEEAYRVGEKEKLVVFLARVSREKGLHVFVDMCRRLAGEFKCAVMGDDSTDPDYTAEMYSLAKK
ncbi:MAG: hypothetical protein ACP5MH_11700, partial [Thermoproteus sp.]